MIFCRTININTVKKSSNDMAVELSNQEVSLIILPITSRYTGQVFLFTSD